jgi:hypothetical protein
LGARCAEKGVWLGAFVCQLCAACAGSAFGPILAAAQARGALVTGPRTWLVACARPRCYLVALGNAAVASPLFTLGAAAAGCLLAAAALGLRLTAVLT